MGERDLNLYDEIPLLDQRPVGADKFPVLYDLVKDCHTMTGIDYILGKGEYPLRAMIVAGGNPVCSNPNSIKVSQAFSSLDLLVVRDLFLTETAAHAHYVLPAASYLERSELHIFSHLQWVSLSKKILEIPEVIDEYSFWHDLAEKLGFGDKYFPWETELEVNRWLLEPTGISLKELQERPQGVRYKPIKYRKFHKRPFSTPSGMFEFSSEYLKNYGFPGIPEYVEPFYLRKGSKDFPLILISGARKMVFLNSRYHNIPRFHRLQPLAEVEIHPEDADRLGLSNSEQVRIVSEIGSMTVTTRIIQDTEIIPGVIQIAQGWEKESNVNRITFDHVNDPISGFPQLKSVPVRVEKIDPDKSSTEKP
jgi:anaerobic selenocysteine-containing dehydrogenase